MSAIGFGCMSLSHGYGLDVPELDGINLIRPAFDLGITFSPGYGIGRDGHGSTRSPVDVKECSPWTESRSAMSPQPDAQCIPTYRSGWISAKRVANPG